MYLGVKLAKRAELAGQKWQEEQWQEWAGHGKIPEDGVLWMRPLPTTWDVRESTRLESIDRELGELIDGCSLLTAWILVMMLEGSRSGERQSLARSVVERTRNNILGGAFGGGACVCGAAGAGVTAPGLEYLVYVNCELNALAIIGNESEQPAYGTRGLCRILPGLIARSPQKIASVKG